MQWLPVLVRTCAQNALLGQPMATAMVVLLHMCKGNARRAANAMSHANVQPLAYLAQAQQQPQLSDGLLLLMAPAQSHVAPGCRHVLSNVSQHRVICVLLIHFAPLLWLVPSQVTHSSVCSVPVQVVHDRPTAKMILSIALHGRSSASVLRVARSKSGWRQIARRAAVYVAHQQWY
jgi:hypothetical protein